MEEGVPSQAVWLVLGNWLHTFLIRELVNFALFSRDDVVHFIRLILGTFSVLLSSRLEHSVCVDSLTRKAELLRARADPGSRSVANSIETPTRRLSLLSRAHCALLSVMCSNWRSGA